MYFIVNPSTAGGRGVVRWDFVQREISKMGIKRKDYEVGFTELIPIDDLVDSQQSKSTAFELAKDAANSHELIVNVGGDGTLNEIFNGVFASNQPSTPILPLPVGTGNDLLGGAAPLQIPYHPNDLKNQIKAILPENREIKAIDVGLVGKRYFAGAVGIGYDAVVTYTANQQSKFLKGTWNYLAALLRSLWSYPGQNIRIIVHGKVFYEGKAYLTAIGNGNCYGGGMKICPFASIYDGKLDFTTAKKVTRIQLVVMLPKVYDGTLVYLKKWIKIGRAVEIRVEPGHDEDNPVLVQVDGEVIGKLPATFKAIPKKLHYALLKNT